MAAKRVAIVGSGPTGRAAARELAERSAAVTVFEKESEPGGLMRWGYPDLRMPLSITRRDVEALRGLGVRFEVEAELGRTVRLEDLERDYEAILITVGAPRPKRLNIPGEDSPGVHNALEFLHAAREDRPLPTGPAVAVIGGGDTAVDAAVTAAKHGAERVTVMYRGSAEQALVQPHEFKRSQEAGVAWRYQAQPMKIAATDNGLLVTLDGVDESSQGPKRFNSVIVAIGQETDSGLLKTLGLTMSANGSTNHPKVWLAGGSRYGSDRLAKAIQDGRAVAKQLLRT